MGRHKTTLGTCRLCGKQTELTFEHIPPKSTFNKNGRYVISSMEDFVKRENPLEDNPKGIIKQGGIGSNSLCFDCNNLLGRYYVESYQSWVLSGIEVLKFGDHPVYSFKLGDIEPLNIIKQIFSMFISLGEEDFYKNHTELCDFVRNPESNLIPDKYQIFTYLNEVGNVKYIPPMVSGNFRTGNIVFCSEFTFPPFGYVFTIDSTDKFEKLTNITEFKNYKYGEKVNYTFTMFKLENHLPFPMDYRSKDEINDGLSKGKFNFFRFLLTLKNSLFKSLNRWFSHRG